MVLLADHTEHMSCFKNTQSPLVVPIPFNKKGDNMMRMLQSCVSKNILRI